MTVPLTQENVFGKESPHRVVAPNKVVELKEGSLVLEKEFEGSTELPFFVRLFPFRSPVSVSQVLLLIRRNAFLHLGHLSRIPCEEMLVIPSKRQGTSSSLYKAMSPKLKKWWS